MMTDNKSHRLTAKREGAGLSRSLHEHFRDLGDMLETVHPGFVRLEKDLACDSAAEKWGINTSLVFVVDFSEVYSFVTQEPLVYGDPLADLVSGDVFSGAHHAALTFLFRGLPYRLVLLPPHMFELDSFVGQVCEKHLMQSLDQSDLRAEVESLKTKYPPIAKLLELMSRWNAARRDPKGPVTSEELACFENQARAGLTAGEIRQIWTVLGQVFAPVFCSLKKGTITQIHELRQLFERRREKPSKIISLQEFDVRLAELADANSAGHERWTEELERYHSVYANGRRKPPTSMRQKSAVARRNDALALRYLEILNPLLHSRGQQLMFVSRSGDIRTVMRRYPGVFGCLGEEYWNSSSAVTTKIIFRNWQYFFEVGGIWEQARSEPNGTDRTNTNFKRVAAMRERIKKRISYLRGLLNVLKHAHIQKACQKLEGHITNTYTMFSAARATLRDHIVHDEEDRLFAMFVRAVIDPDRFIEERKHLRTELDDEIAKLVRTLYERSVTEPTPEKVGWGTRFRESERFRSILVSVFHDPESGSWLLFDYPEGRVRKTVHDVLDITLGSYDWDSETKLRDRIEKLRPSLVKDDDRSLEYLLLATWSFAHHQWRLAIAQLDRALDQLASRIGAPAWVFWQLLYADCKLQETETQRSADRVLSSLLDEISGIPDFPAGVHAVILDARLRLNLDAAEQCEENQDAFPIIWDPREPGRVALEVVVEDAWQLWSSPGLRSAISKRTLRPLANDLLYSEARLATVDFDEERNLSTHDIVELVEFVESWPNATDEELDTLGYYYLKRANQEGPSAVGQGFLQKSKLYFDQCSAAVTSKRGRRILSSHLELLREIDDKVFSD